MAYGYEMGDLIMGFLKKIFGGDDSKKEQKYVDKTGIYFFVQCDNCGTCVRVRADKTHDLLIDGSTFTWHKTIVDSKCFRPIPVVVTLNRNYEMTEADIQGGQFISEEAYETWLAEKNKPKQDLEPEPESEDSIQ
jgi:hypothetical protein